MFISAASDRQDSLWVENFGWEKRPMKAHWGPGRRAVHILHYVLQGSGTFNGHPVHQGQGFYIASDSWQEYHPNPDDPWQYFWIMFGGELAKKYVTEVIRPDSHGLFLCNYTGALEQLTERMRYIDGEMTHFASLSWLYRVLDLHGRPREAENPIVRRAKAYISANYHTAITVRGTAEALHVDDRYLYNLFVLHENTTPKRYIDDCRIRAAADLLAQSDASVTEIACAVGFDNVSRFSRFFALHTGVSPTVYRKEKNPTGMAGYSLKSITQFYSPSASDIASQ